MQQLFDLMPNPDEVLELEGYGVYEKMRADPHVFSCLQQRKGWLLAKTWDVLPAGNTDADKRVSDFVSGVVNDRLNFRQFLEDMLSALDYGFSVSEAVWGQKAGSWLIDKLEPRQWSRFAFKPDGTLMLVEPAWERKRLVQPYKFVLHRNEPRPENPYGNSVLTRCYWPWRFKRAGFEFWLTVLEKFGIPSLAALFDGPQNEDQARQMADFISEQLTEMANGATGAFSNVKELKAVEAKGRAEEFRDLITVCNQEISKAILTVTLTSEVGDRGAYSLGEIHKQAQDQLVKKDSNSLAATVNETVVKWLVRLNFGENVQPPRFRFDLFSPASWEQVRDAMDRGFPVSRRATYDTYNIPEPADEKDVFVSPKAAAGIGMNDDSFFLRKNRSRLRISNDPTSKK
jgi:phage gp29-like protein